MSRRAVPIILVACFLAAHVGAAQLDSARQAGLKVLERRIWALTRSAPDSARILAEEYIGLARAWDHEAGIARGENFLAIPYTLKGDHAGALPHYIAALGIYERLGDVGGTAIVHGNIANAYAGLNMLERSVAEYRLSMRDYRLLADPVWEAGMAQEVAQVFQRMGASDSAALYFGRAADMLLAGGSSEHAAMARLHQAQAMPPDTPDPERALVYREALAALGDAAEGPARCGILLGLAECTVKEDPVAALASARKALVIAERLNLTSTRAKAHSVLSAAFERMGSLDSAITHLRGHSAWSDSLHSEERAKAMAEAEQRYASGRKDMELVRNKAQLEQRDTLIKAVTAVAVLALVAGLFAFRAYREKRRGAGELARKNVVINDQLKEKEVLLREIHHRVKNNLQTITSLLRLQARSLQGEEGRNAIGDAMSRVRSMSLIHQDLYHRPGLTSVDMMTYMTKLTNALLRSHGMEQRITAHVDAGTLTLEVEPAVTLGLVANELITNALKHAFPHERSGELWITLVEEDEEVRLEVRDNGIGFEPGAVSIMKEGTASGVDIVQAMAGALQAELSIKRQGGTRVRLRFRHNSRIVPAPHPDPSSTK